jgi:hypothetical protein
MLHQRAQITAWSFIVLTLCDPTEIRLYEQLAIFLFNPKFNYIQNISVNTRYPSGDLTSAIKTAEMLQNSYPTEDPKNIRFKEMKEDLTRMLNAYNLAKNNNFNIDLFNLKTGKPVLVFNPDNGSLIHYYSSSHQAIKGLKIKWKTLIDSIEYKWIIKESLVLSYNPLTLEEIKKYTIRQETYNTLKVKGYNIYLVEIVTNKVIAEYKSIREAALVLKAAQNTIRAAVENGEPFRKIWYIKTKI